ncbi:MAG: chorismate synthase [Candidatus Cloacimonetes bacterium]|nr:chorismate synthase [Candidatus Cloacimonadota bacterium]
MKSDSFGRYFGITTFGESHGPAIGVVLEDIKPGIEFPEEEIRKVLRERRPGKGQFSSERDENDDLVILSGIFEGRTTGTPICLIVFNHDHRPEDYNAIRNIFRPGHGDYCFYKKFKIYDYRGGGRASGRETLARVAAGEMVNHLLGNIEIALYPVQIGHFQANEVDLSFENELHWPDRSNYQQLSTFLTDLKKQGDSCGGIIQAIIRNVPVGLGDPVFEKLDANLAKAILSIGSVKGIEFGIGFQMADRKGSETNDEMSSGGFLSNNSGGITAGISTGQEVRFRFLVKPTPSIRKTQNTMTTSGESIRFSVNGRHDTVIIPRIIPVARAMIKLVLADAISHQNLLTEKPADLSILREVIEKIDEDLLLCLYRRKQISQNIGSLKKNQELPVSDPAREKELFQQLQEKASELDLDQDFVKEIWDRIFTYSRDLQC